MTFLMRTTEKAVAELGKFITSDVIERALPSVHLVTSGEGWRWV